MRHTLAADAPILAAAHAMPAEATITHAYQVQAMAALVAALEAYIAQGLGLTIPRHVLLQATEVLQ